MNLHLSRADVVNDDVALEMPMLFGSVLAVAVFAVWTVTLLAIAHSQRHGLTTKTLWGLAVLALPIFGGALWLLFVKNARPAADSAN